MIDFNYIEYIKGIMEAMETNLAIVELKIPCNNYLIPSNDRYKFFVTIDSNTKELSFFTLNGTQCKWLSDNTKSYLEDTEMVSIHNIVEYSEKFRKRGAYLDD